MNTASGLIQIMLAPGLMISACGLLLLGMNNKYSLVVNRIRLLNDERRKSRYKEAEGESSHHRHKSVGIQIDKLSFRLSLIRNAVFSYSIAIAFFIIASLMIGINQMQSPNDLSWLVIGNFLLGMFFVLAGILFAAVEVRKGFQIMKIEIEDLS